MNPVHTSLNLFGKKHAGSNEECSFRWVKGDSSIPSIPRAIEIKAFQLRHEDNGIEVCGLVFNDFNRKDVKRENRLARKDVLSKAKEYDWYVFKRDVPHSDSYFRAAREGMPIGYTKGTHGTVKTEFAEFADEFFGRIGL